MTLSQKFVILRKQDIFYKNTFHFQMSLNQIAFIIVFIVCFSIAARQYRRLYRNIHFGKEEKIEGSEGQRWKNVLLVAFGQKKMFKRLLPAVLHFFIYFAFVITQIELIEIFVDGFTGHHRIFAPYLGGFYTFIISFIEILSVLALIATIIFLARRNLLPLMGKPISRFQKTEMNGWPKLDANLILLGELALVTGIFLMNSADIVLQDVDPAHYHKTGSFAISGFLGPLLLDAWPREALVLVERTGWWLHLITVFLFINYLPKSKHLHIFLAFPNVFFSKLQPRGEMDNMPEIMNEVKSMMGLLVEGAAEMEMTDDFPEFGAKDIFDLSWKNIMDAYSCTECGRCTDNCPANLTGKKLSPRKVLMDIRDRVEEVANNIDSQYDHFIAEDKRKTAQRLDPSNYDDQKSLFDYISREEIHACTTCNACVEACPVMINPLEPILKLRRYEILSESAGPADWTPMFNSMENSGSVWAIPDDRDAWTKQLTE